MTTVISKDLMTVDWVDGKLRLIDQTLLPGTLSFNDYTDWREVARAITIMVVRGAPAIGCTAALGMVLGIRALDAPDIGTLICESEPIANEMKQARPTAVNLMWAVDRIMDVLKSSSGTVELAKDAVLNEARTMLQEDIDTNRAMGRFGAKLLQDGEGVLTHCNAGALATVGYGTALGVFRAAVEAGKKIHVYADETRPRLQGMKLTAWELMRDNIPVTIVTDNMAAVLMREGKVKAAVVGADRIAANGDVANKIGTYTVAILCKHHSIPFYVAAPYSTIDFELAEGSMIPIEERDPTEVTHVDGVKIAPEGADVWTPAFDVTPNELISAIITERGIIRAPYKDNLIAST